MIDHIGVAVSDLERSVAFYTKALAPLGYTLIMKFDVPAGPSESDPLHFRPGGFGVAGFGVGGKPDFWLAQGEAKQPIHVAFRASGRAKVREFYEAAIAAGGKDNGPPGTRPIYHEHYYGAFVHDFDGHNIEAVCHEPFLG